MTPLKKVAVHEAGHAIAIWYCTATSQLACVSTLSDGETAGHVKYKLREAPLHQWCVAVICLAGVAAEVKVYGVARSGPAKADLLQALQAIRSTPEDHPWGHLTGKVLPFRSMYRSTLSDREVEGLTAAYRAASTMLDAHNRAFRKLVKALMSRRILTEKELTPILGNRERIFQLGTAHFLRPQARSTRWQRFKLWLRRLWPW